MLKDGGTSPLHNSADAYYVYKMFHHSLSIRLPLRSTTTALTVCIVGIFKAS